MSGHLPRITVITPSLNQATFLEETIRGVLDQRYPNLQYGIIDGGSTDGSAAIIERYRPRLDFAVIEPDRGQSHAINKGLARADGEIVTWLCADDTYAPGALRAVGEFFADHPGAPWVAGHCRHIDARGAMLDASPAVGASPERSLADLLLGRGSVCFPQPGVFWRRSLQQAVGPLDEALHYQMDYDLWCRFVQCAGGPMLLDRELAHYRLHDASKTCSSRHRFMAERIRVRRRYAQRLPLSDRLRLIRLLGYLRREHTIETSAGRIWRHVVRRPWWLASQQVREALRQGVGP